MITFHLFWTKCFASHVRPVTEDQIKALDRKFEVAKTKLRYIRYKKYYCGLVS